jgi:hypothetical protein
MFRIITAIRILFGLVAATISAQPVAESEEGVAMRLNVERFQQLVADQLDARVEDLTSTIASDAFKGQIGALIARLTDLGNRPASASSAAAQFGNMRCRVANLGVLQCTVVGAPSGGPELVAERDEPEPPAAPAEH